MEKSRKNFHEFEAQLDELCTSISKKYFDTGIAVAVVEDGKIASCKYYGYQDRKNKTLVDGNTMFLVGSISKAVTSWGILQLCEKGLIQLQDPIGIYLKNLKSDSKKYDINQITIKQLLSHTSGLAREDYYGEYQKRQSVTCRELNHEIKLLPKKLHLKNAPGTTFLYTGTGYTLLQFIIEHVTKMKFSDYMKQEILSPLQMEHSSFCENEMVNKKLACNYGILGRRLKPRIFYHQAATGLYTTLEELTYFLLANLRKENTVIPYESIKNMQTRISRQTPYGLGFFLLNMHNNYKIVMHDGINVGWVSRFMMEPNENAGLIILTNSSRGFEIVNEISLYWSEWLMGSLQEFYKKELMINHSMKFILKHVIGQLKDLF